MSRSNPRITKKERALIKGCIRRTFSRSELRRKILDACQVKNYYDPSRKRVSRWGRCSGCQEMIPLYLMEVDHHLPIVPVDSSFEEMDLDAVVDNTWCDERNLKPLCEACHNVKTQAENKERRRFKKEAKK